MTDVPGAADFEAALGDLQDHLPEWWASRDPTSNLHAILDAAAGSIDELAAIFQTVYEDQDLALASAEGLQRNFAFAWGVQNEQLPTVLPQMRAYIAARAAEDGSLAGLVNTLTTLVNIAVNTAGGDVLTFPPDGSGLYFPDPVGGTNLVFPAGGEGVPLPAAFGVQQQGLAMYEFTPGNGPSAQVGLLFPHDGSGLMFPEYPDTVPSDNLIGNSGISAPGGPGLVFASNQFVQIVPQWSSYTLLVEVQNWLSFDRLAFARAVARFQPADWYPTRIVEISSYH